MSEIISIQVILITNMRVIYAMNKINIWEIICYQKI